MQLSGAVSCKWRRRSVWGSCRKSHRDWQKKGTWWRWNSGASQDLNIAWANLISPAKPQYISITLNCGSVLLYPSAGRLYCCFIPSSQFSLLFLASSHTLSTLYLLHLLLSNLLKILWFSWMIDELHWIAYSHFWKSIILVLESSVQCMWCVFVFDGWK